MSMKVLLRAMYMRRRQKRMHGPAFAAFAAASDAEIGEIFMGAMGGGDSTEGDGEGGGAGDGDEGRPLSNNSVLRDLVEACAEDHRYSSHSADGSRGSSSQWSEGVDDMMGEVVRSARIWGRTRHEHASPVFSSLHAHLFKGLMVELGPSILPGLVKPLEEAVSASGEDMRVKQCTAVEIMSGLVRGAACLARASAAAGSAAVDETWAMAVPLFAAIAESGSPDSVYDLADGIRYCAFDRTVQVCYYIFQSIFSLYSVYIQCEGFAKLDFLPIAPSTAPCRRWRHCLPSSRVNSNDACSRPRRVSPVPATVTVVTVVVVVVVVTVTAVSRVRWMWRWRCRTRKAGERGVKATKVKKA
jgi:hypothetical protein